VISPSEFDVAVAALQARRKTVAARNRDLSLRELQARELRLTVESRLRAGVRAADGVAWEVVPMPKTEAEKLAKSDPQYLTYERETIQLTHNRDVLLAQAESMRLELQGFIAMQKVTT
jgi:hypothetical protein